MITENNTTPFPAVRPFFTRSAWEKIAGQVRFNVAVRDVRGVRVESVEINVPTQVGEGFGGTGSLVFNLNTGSKYSHWISATEWPRDMKSREEFARLVSNNIVKNRDAPNPGNKRYPHFPV